jgi:EmrB/QacA subfamily drug resistance transporter
MTVQQESAVETIPAAPAEKPSRAPTRLTWILIVCCVSQFMVILDLSIVNVALPSIQSSLGFNAPDLQWVVDAYAITFAGFLMLGGRVADHFGQRRTFVAALALFGAASLAGGAASSQGMLIGARAAQGLGGALMAACSLAIITSSFEPGPRLHRAIGIWAAMNGAGGAAGVLFGGIITQEISWRWVLLINPPIAVAAAVIGFAVVVDRRRGRAAAAFDFGGALTLTVGQMVLVYGVVQAGLRGWTAAAALGPIAGGLGLLALFGVIEARIASAPLVPFPDLTRPLKVANGIVVLFSAALFPMWFISSLYLQQVLGLSPLKAGLTFLPMALTIMLVASQTGKLVSRFGVRQVLAGGLTMMTAGLVLFTRVAPSGSAIVYVMVPGLLTAAGIAMSIVPSTVAATQGAKQGQQGLASGLVNTSRQVGGGLGLALLITLATQHTTHLIGSGGGVPQALTQGFRLAYLIAAGLCAAAAMLTLTQLPRLPSGAASIARRAAVPIGVAIVIAGFAVIAAATAGNRGAPVGAYVTRDTYVFVTEPALHPPKVITGQVATDRLAPGYILVTNFYDLTQPPMVGQSGPLMLDNHAQPVWFRPVPRRLVASNLARQTFHGKPALSWWQGVITNAGQTLSGEDVVVDQHYRTVATLRGKDGWIITLHEMVIDGNHAWVTANKDIPLNLSRYGGTYNGVVIDSAVQEYDLRTGKLLFTWDALKHVPLSDSWGTVPTNGYPWDAYHVNSIQVGPNGTFLTSMRNTWAAYLVDSRTGRTLWTLGGRHSSFAFARGARFEWQHDVALHRGGIVTMFDDHCCQITGGGTYVAASAPSRALTLRLDLGARTATVVTQRQRAKGFDSEYMGSAQNLPGGNLFIGWGSQPYFSEYSSGGDLLLDARFPKPNISYRAERAPWVGLPLYPPRAAVRVRSGRKILYVSWNGATKVQRWRVLAARVGVPSFRPLGTAPRTGFETAILAPGGYAHFKIQALDARGRVLGTTKAV